MSRRRASWVAWSIWTLTLVLVPPKLLLEFANTPALPANRMLAYLVLLIFATVGAIIAARLPQNLLGWIFGVSALLMMLGSVALEIAVYTLITAPRPVSGAAWLVWLGAWVQTAAWLLALSFLPLLFPTGRLPSRRWRPVAWLAIAGLLLFSVLALLSPESLDFRLPFLQHPLGLALPARTVKLVFVAFFLVEGAAVAGSVAAVSVRFRHATGVERQQLKWFALSASLPLLGFGTFAIGAVLEINIGSLPFVLAVAGLPLATGIAILKHNLYDIDLLINRTLVYGALTLAVSAIYVLIVGYLSALFQTSGELPISLLAAGVVAVLFQPLREWLQRAVNRLIYGERDDPYVVLARLGQRLEAALAPQAVLPTIVETLAQTLKLPYVAIALAPAVAEQSTPASGPAAQSFSIAAAAGASSATPLRLPLVYQGEQVGQLIVAPRAAGESFNPTDRRLLEALARQAGVAVHAVRLTAELQRARQRLVSAREEERRRLRRDLHDGLGQQLASQTLTLTAVRRLLRQDPETADQLLSDATLHAQDAIADIRRLVYALRPPALDDLGLVAALREQVAQYQESGIQVVLDFPDQLPALPAAVEVAIYRIVQEALTNIVRHAQARHCTVKLVAEAGVCLEVRDDGQGLLPGHPAGVGLTSMRERAVELGGRCVIEPAPAGGTLVRADLPIPG